jgi:hypothetical protein
MMAEWVRILVMKIKTLIPKSKLAQRKLFAEDRSFYGRK